MDKGQLPLDSTDKATSLEGREYSHMDTSPQG